MCAFRYEKKAQIIYAFDVWTYHIMVYLIHNQSWNNLPSFTWKLWKTPFWILAAVSFGLWTYMVLYRAYEGNSSWTRSPHDCEMMMWFLCCCVVHPIFFYHLAYYSRDWKWFLAISCYRGWAARQMILFIQEVREKMFLLQLLGRRYQIQVET